MAHNRSEIRNNKEEDEKKFLESINKYFETQRILETETEEIENTEHIQPKSKTNQYYLLLMVIFICFSIILWKIFSHDDSLRANILSNINDFEKIF